MCFFFQAEDGIRDYKVTGVQTCALPIYPCSWRENQPLPEVHPLSFPHPSTLSAHLLRFPCAPRSLPARYRCIAGRSEERRVGKECRSRRSAELHQDKG